MEISEEDKKYYKTAVKLLKQVKSMMGHINSVGTYPSTVSERTGHVAERLKLCVGYLEPLEEEVNAPRFVQLKMEF